MGRIRAAMTLWVGCALGVCATQADAEPRTAVLELRVRTHDEAAADAALLREAIATAEQVFAKEGIRLRWTHCRSDPAHARCHDAPVPNEFVVRLLPGHADGGSHGCGVSLRPHSAPGHYITLFLGCVRQGAEAFSVPTSVVLAYVIAHEIGHLLLPNGHSPAGIMRARPDRLDWHRAARGALEFHLGDREQMRAALQHRLATPWAGGVKR